MKRLSCHGCGAPVSLTKAAFHVCAYCGNTYQAESPRYTLEATYAGVWTAPPSWSRNGEPCSTEGYSPHRYIPASCRY